jgi:hypothetical protein
MTEAILCKKIGENPITYFIVQLTTFLSYKQDRCLDTKIKNQIVKHYSLTKLLTLLP